MFRIIEKSMSNLQREYFMVIEYRYKFVGSTANECRIRVNLIYSIILASFEFNHCFVLS